MNREASQIQLHHVVDQGGAPCSHFHSILDITVDLPLTEAKLAFDGVALPQGVTTEWVLSKSKIRQAALHKDNERILFL